ncbi:hypothetical protein BGW38_010061, partial [Lunasporangiospora selenospora]
MAGRPDKDPDSEHHPTSRPSEMSFGAHSRHTSTDDYPPRHPPYGAPPADAREASRGMRPENGFASTDRPRQDRRAQAHGQELPSDSARHPDAGDNHNPFDPAADDDGDFDGDDNSEDYEGEENDEEDENRPYPPQAPGPGQSQQSPTGAYGLEAHVKSEVSESGPLSPTGWGQRGPDGSSSRAAGPMGRGYA